MTSEIRKAAERAMHLTRQLLGFGRQRLVAVEYAVPIAAWGDVAPVLHGVEFHRNDGLGLWVLHVWHFKSNPAGMFTDWNPTVSCEHAAP